MRASVKTNIKGWWQTWVHWDIQAETLRSLGTNEIVSRESSDRNRVKGELGLEVSSDLWLIPLSFCLITGILPIPRRASTANCLRGGEEVNNSGPGWQSPESDTLAFDNWFGSNNNWEEWRAQQKPPDLHAFVVLMIVLLQSGLHPWLSHLTTRNESAGLQSSKSTLTTKLPFNFPG